MTILDIHAPIHTLTQTLAFGADKEATTAKVLNDIAAADKKATVTTMQTSKATGKFVLMT